MDFYSDVLLELVTALGAALFIGNGLALLRRRADRQEAARAYARTRPGSPVRKQVKRATTGNLDQAPAARTITYMVLGLVVAVWGLATIIFS